MGASLLAICARASSAHWMVAGVMAALLLPLVTRGVEGGATTEAGYEGSLSARTGVASREGPSERTPG